MDNYEYLRILAEQEKQRRMDRNVILAFVCMFFTVITFFGLLYAGIL